MVVRKSGPVFSSDGNKDGYLSEIPSGLLEPKVDNPDGVVQAFGLGPYEVGPERSREFSQGAGTPKGNIGNASGRGRTMKLKDDAF
jgi:hypothetical protein